MSCRNTVSSCLFALSVAAAGCGRAQAAKGEAAYVVDDGAITIKHPGPHHFDSAAVSVGPSLPLPQVTAHITTIEALTSPIFASLSGRVVEAKVRLGDRVEKGQPLVLVRSADLSTLEREVRSAELAVNTRSASVERMLALVESRAGSENDLILARSELEEAKLGANAARSRLKSLQIERASDDTAFWVLASRSGTVVQLEATPGSQVGPDRGLPVATVADLAEVLAVADVPQRDALELASGAPAKIFPFGRAGEVVAGVVEVVSEVVDPERQTVPVRVRVDNAAHKLRPNAYVDLVFGSLSARTTLLVPAVSVVRDGPNAVVFVETQPGHYLRRPVVLGRRSQDLVEVVSGVASGERVVTKGALLLVNAIGET